MGKPVRSYAQCSPYDDADVSTSNLRTQMICMDSCKAWSHTDPACTFPSYQAVQPFQRVDKLQASPPCVAGKRFGFMHGMPRAIGGYNEEVDATDPQAIAQKLLEQSDLTFLAVREPSRAGEKGWSLVQARRARSGEWCGRRSLIVGR